MRYQYQKVPTLAVVFLKVERSFIHARDIGNVLFQYEANEKQIKTN